MKPPADWPRHPQTGRYLCSKDRPMPKGAHGLWSHEGAQVVGLCETRCCDLVLCQHCGSSWKLPLES